MMSALMEGDKRVGDISILIAKLGHQLEEIRVRALRNLQSKLLNQIVTREELAHESQLFINLLQWFNQPSAPLKKDVLQLLESLSRVGAAAGILHQIGCVEFLSHLRGDTEDDDLLQIIDNILNNVFFIHEIEDPHEQVHYEVQTTTNFMAAPEITTDKEQSSHLPGTKMPPHYTGMPHQNESSVLPELQSHSQITKTLNKPPTTGVQNKSSSSMDITEEDAVRVNGHRQSLEWITLTSSDRHILSVTDGRLQSHNIGLKLQSLEFFRDVLLQDFPAELFIQRPTIVKTILESVAIYISSDLQVVSSCIECLQELTCKIRQRLLQSSNINFLSLSKDARSLVSSSDSVSMKTLTSSLQSTPNGNHLEHAATNRQTVGHDNESPGNSHSQRNGADFESELVIEALKTGQWTALGYCYQAMTTVLSVLTSEACPFSIQIDATDLLREIVYILEMSDLISLWHRDNKERKPIYDSIASLRQFGAVLKYFYAQVKDKMEETQRTNICQDSWATLVCLTRLTVKLLYATVPLDRFYEAIPIELVTVLSSFLPDPFLHHGHPELSRRLSIIVSKCDTAFYNSFVELESVRSSMSQVLEFIATDEQQERLRDEDKLSLALDGTRSLPYHCCHRFIEKAVTLCSHIGSSPCQDKRMIDTSCLLLLKLFSHRVGSIRKTAYESCMEVVKEALSTSLVTDPLSTRYQKAVFMINISVIEEVICFGTQDKEVAPFAVSILTYLLLGRLNMVPMLWKKLMECVAQYMPYLQAVMSVDAALQKCVGGLSDPTRPGLTSDGTITTLPQVEQIRALLRLMFSRKKEMRMRGLMGAVFLLSEEDKKRGTMTNYSYEDSVNASEMFTENHITDNRYEEDLIPATALEEHEILNLWNIFTSDIDDSLRENALDQLRNFIKEANNFKAFVQNDVIKRILEEINRGIHQTKGSSSSNGMNMNILGNCVSILSLVAERKPLVRHCMACNKELLFDLFKLSILGKHDKILCRNISRLLTYLLFDESSRDIADNENRCFQLSTSLLRSFILPIKISSFMNKSSHQESLPFMETLMQEPFQSSLRVSWNLALVKAGFTNQTPDYQKLCQELPISPGELNMLSWCIPLEAVKTRMHSIGANRNAASLENGLVALNRHIFELLYQMIGNQEGIFDGVKSENVKEVIELMCSREILIRALDVFDFHERKMRLVTAAIRPTTLLLHFPNAVINTFRDRIFRQVIRTDGIMWQVLESRTELIDGTLKMVRRDLAKDLLRLISDVVQGQFSEQSNKTKLYAGSDVGELIAMLLGSVSSVEADSYYDLPILERTLECLTHLTSTSGWSLEYHSSGETLSANISSSLIQTLSSFHTERIGAADSFMGKGVITKTVTCLCHVARELQIYAAGKDWTTKWTRLAVDTEGSENFAWLVLLLTDRVLDVRWSAWAMATTLMSLELGGASMVGSFQVFPGGIWATALSVAVDDYESPMVRNQAFRLLSNLCYELLKKRSESSTVNLWASMIVQDTISKAVVSGLPAFLLLLEHLNFFGKLKEVTMIVAPKHTLKVTKAIQYDGSTGTESSIPSNEGASTEYEPIQTSTSSSEGRKTNSSSSSHSSVKGLHSDSRVSTPGGNESGSPRSILLPPSSHGSTNENGGNFSKDSDGGSLPVSLSDTDITEDHSLEVSRLSAMLKVGFIQLGIYLLFLDAKKITDEIVKRDILTHIIRTIDADQIYSMIFQSALNQPSAVHYHRSRLIDTIALAERSCFFIRCMASFDAEVQLSLQSDIKFINRILRVFDIHHICRREDLMPYSSYLITLWKESLSTLLFLLGKPGGTKTTPQKVYIAIASGLTHLVGLLALMSTWKEIRDNEKTSVYRLILELLSRFFCNIYQQKDSSLLMTVSEHLDILPQSNHLSRIFKGTEILQMFAQKRGNDFDDDDINKLSLGGFLTATIFKIMDSEITCTNLDKKIQEAALSALLFVSKSCKKFALRVGFCEYLTEQLKELDVRLNVASLELDEDCGKQRTEKDIFVEMKSTVSLCRNFAFEYGHVKEAFIDCGVLRVVKSIWSWCMINGNLFCAVMEFLTCLSAKCEKAQRQICHMSAYSKGNSDDASLLLNCIKMAAKLHAQALATNGKVDMKLKRLFELLGNLCVINECRSRLTKECFLTLFLNVSRPAGANKRQKNIAMILQSLWLRLMAVLSFYADGAQSIFKTKGLLSRLLDIAKDSGNVTQRDQAILILRNMAAQPNYRAILSADADFINTFLVALDNSSIWTKALVTSGFVFLMTNCHKAKVCLKKTKLLGKLQQIDKKIRNGQLISSEGRLEGYEGLKKSIAEGLNFMMEKEKVAQ